MTIKLTLCSVCKSTIDLENTTLKWYGHACYFCSGTTYYCSRCAIILLIGVKDLGDSTGMMLRHLHERSDHSSVDITI